MRQPLDLLRQRAPAGRRARLRPTSLERCSRRIELPSGGHAAHRPPGRRASEATISRKVRRNCFRSQPARRTDPRGRELLRSQTDSDLRPQPAQRALASGQSGQRRSRAARALWSESGGRGGVSDLGGGEQLTAEASAASPSGSPSARTRNVALCARRPPRCPMEQKRLKDTLGLTLERVSGVPPCGLE